MAMCSGQAVSLMCSGPPGHRQWHGSKRLCGCRVDGGAVGSGPGKDGGGVREVEGSGVCMCIAGSSSHVVQLAISSGGQQGKGAPMVACQCHVVVCWRSKKCGACAWGESWCTERCESVGVEFVGKALSSRNGVQTQVQLGSRTNGYVPCKAAIVSALVVSNQAAVKIRSSCEREVDSWSSRR